MVSIMYKVMFLAIGTWITINGECPAGHTPCNDQQDSPCVDDFWRCDSSEDCPNGEDEANCGGICRDGMIKCMNTVSFLCITPGQQCDGNPDCCDGDDSGCDNQQAEDEQNCNAAPANNCQENQFDCGGADVCIPEYWRCDDYPDCQDGSDEQGCNDN